MKDNFPELLENHKIEDLELGREITDEERKNLHKHNIIPMLQIDKEMFSPIGGGVTMNGLSLRGMLNAINQLKLIYYLENKVLSFYEENKESIILKTGNIENIEFHFENLDNPLVLYDKNKEHKIDIEWNPQNINELSLNFTKCKCAKKAV